MKEENHKRGLRLAPIDVSPPADSLVGFRCRGLNSLYKWSINQCITIAWFHNRIELFDNMPCPAQGNLNRPRKAPMNQWTKREAEIEHGKAHPQSSQQILIRSNGCGPLVSRKKRLKTLIRQKLNALIRHVAGHSLVLSA